MLDLLGDEVTTPTGTTAKGISNASMGFAEFWQAWPKGTRKVAKQQCLDKWAKHGYADNAAHIVAHVEWMKTQEDWLKQGGAFICAPLVYLNQTRWMDWEPEPERPKQPSAIETILAHKGVPMPADVKAKIEALRQAARVSAAMRQGDSA